MRLPPNGRSDRTRRPPSPDHVTFHKAVFFGDELVAVGPSGKDATTAVYVRRDDVWTRVATDLPRVPAIHATEHGVYLGTSIERLRYSPRHSTDTRTCQSSVWAATL